MIEACFDKLLLYYRIGKRMAYHESVMIMLCIMKMLSNEGGITDGT